MQVSRKTPSSIWCPLHIHWHPHLPSNSIPDLQRSRIFKSCVAVAGDHVLIVFATCFHVPMGSWNVLQDTWLVFYRSVSLLFYLQIPNILSFNFPYLLKGRWFLFFSFFSTYYFLICSFYYHHVYAPQELERLGVDLKQYIPPELHPIAFFAQSLMARTVVWQCKQFSFFLFKPFQKPNPPFLLIY